MGFISKILGGGRNKKLEDELNGYNIVVSRLQKLVNDGIISEKDLTTDLVEYDGENVPKIIVSIDKLLNSGSLTGIEKHVERFCHLVGMGIGLEELQKKM
jgi:hypothetical protein